MLTKGFTDRRRSASKVAATAKRNAPMVAEKTETNLLPFLREGESMPDFNLVQALINRSLLFQVGQLGKINRSNHLTGVDGTRTRLRRDQAIEKCYRLLLSLRDVVEGSYGTEGMLTYLDIRGTTPRQPQELSDQVTMAIQGLEDPQKFPPTRKTTLHREEWLADLRAGLLELDEAIYEYDTELSDRNTTLALRKQLRQKFDLNYRGFLRILEGLYMVAEEPGLVERLRPNISKRGSRHGDEEEGEPAILSANPERNSGGANGPQAEEGGSGESSPQLENQSQMVGLLIKPDPV